MVNVREADISVIKALKCFRAGQPSAWPMSLCSLHYLSGDWLGWATPSALPSSRAAGLALGQLPGDREDPYPGVDAKVAELSPTSSIFPTSSFLASFQAIGQSHGPNSRMPQLA